MQRVCAVAKEIMRAGKQREPYFDAEAAMDWQWAALIWPWIEGVDFGHVVDLAAGQGHSSARLLPHAGTLTVVDISATRIEQCRQRFAGDAKVRCLQTNGYSLAGIVDASVTLLFSFGAMVHFDSDVIRVYLLESARVLASGGQLFCHHSNFTALPGGQVDRAPHRRNYMSRTLFAHYAVKAGLEVVRQQEIPCGDFADLDCFSLLRKP